MHLKTTLLLLMICSTLFVFDKNNIDYALYGGLAVALYGFVRFTQDIDLIILPEDLKSTESFN